MLTLLNPFRFPTPIIVPVLEDWVVDVDPPSNHFIPRSSFGDVAGAFLICIQSAKGGGAAPSGFTPIPLPGFDGTINLRVAYQLSTAPGGNVTVIDAGRDSIAAILRFSGVHPNNPIAAFDHAGAVTATPICPPVNTPAKDAFVLRILAADGGNITVDGGYPAGHAGLFVRATTPSADCSCGVASFLQESAGTTGTAQFALTASRASVAATVAMAAASPTP